ncbi:MAG TPA: sigma-70 family RNA polymerase sigma factor [Kofleriaceae bacterium]|nr:sigma-70 family RNA polymerase sigma factor [Kofleriaceae bacterium]
MTDAELIEATRRGESEAFAILVERYQRMVEAIAYSTTRRAALVDDITQDTFVTAWRTIDRLRDVTRLRAWLCSIARNVARNTRRRYRREAPLRDVELAQTPFDDLSDRERDRDVAKALARLPVRYREPLVLFYYEHCTVKEVADALAVGEDAILQRLSRGRRRLGEALATDVEIALERKPSRAVLAACVLALLPFRAASAAPVAAPAASAATTPRWRIALGVLAAHWRFPAAVLASAAALVVVVAATERSNAIAARSHAQSTPPPSPPEAKPADETNHAKRTPPQLPDDEDDGRVWANISVASTDSAESCARGARGLVSFVLDRDAIRKHDDGQLYYEPSPEVERTAEAAAARAAESCRGIAKWPELYLRCEGTVFDIMDGNVTCYPYDPFNS